MRRALLLVALAVSGCGDASPPAAKAPAPPMTAQEQRLAEKRRRAEERRAWQLTDQRAEQAAATDWSNVPASELREVTLDLFDLG